VDTPGTDFLTAPCEVENDIRWGTATSLPKPGKNEEIEAGILQTTAK
jgi:hypothetical protein